MKHTCTKCGSEFERLAKWEVKYRVTRCKPCRAAYAMEWIRANHEKWKNRPSYGRHQYKYNPEVARRQYEKNRNDPVWIAKDATRRATNHAIAGGKLKRQPCEICGVANAEAHHFDYSKPLDVRWLCLPHLRAVHRGEIQ